MKTKAKGTAQFTAATTLNVMHGLVATPTKIMVRFVTESDGDTSALWITAIGATTFTVNRSNNIGMPRVRWNAEI